MALSRVRAADALARVEANPELRAAFLAAYTGDEDALAALREAADPAQPSSASVARAERLKEWERAAYGRTATPEQEDVASHARDEITWEEDHRAAISAALETAVAALERAAKPPAEMPVAAALPVEQTAATPRSRARVTIPVVIVIAVVGIVVGAAVASGALATRGTAERHSSSTPSSSARSENGSIVTRTYTASQVSGWFAATAEGADTFPQPNYLTFIGLHDSNTRFVATGSTGWSLWVGKSLTGQTCLLINGTIKLPKTSLSSCLQAAAIRQGKAIVINSHGINATLTKRDLVVAVTQG